MNVLKKSPEEKPKQKKSKSAFSMAELVNGDFLSRDKVIAKLPFLFFLALLVLFYIGYGYYVERTVKELYDLEVELKELKSEYISAKSRLVEFSKQSQVAQAVKELGLYESVVSPYKIEIDQKLLEKSDK